MKALENNGEYLQIHSYILEPIGLMMKKRKYSEVKIVDKPSIKTKIKTFDEFLSNDGGFQLGNLVLMTGTSGAGKTTLCKLIQKVCNQDSVFHALESLASSVARQTERIKISHDNAYITDGEDYEDFDDFIKFLYKDKPTFVMVDSLQHAVKQLKKKGMGDTDAHHHVLDSLYTWKDKTQGVVILICQLNKDGSFSGPSGMLFDADVRIHLEFDHKTGERTMETTKNRMGQLDSIFYEFTSDDNVIDFYTNAEWKILKQGIGLSEMIYNTIKEFSKAYKSHENYSKFKKEFHREYKKIYDEQDNDYLVLSRCILLMGELENKYLL